MGAAGKALVVLSQLDGVAGRSFRNLPEVILAEPGHLTPYDVLWADQVVFTTHTVGSVGRCQPYEVSDIRLRQGRRREVSPMRERITT